MNKSILRKIFLVAFASLFAILTGCATPASHTAMTVNKEDIQLKQSTLLKGQMNVSSVAGGKETNPLWTSQVDNQGFKTALEQSLILAGYKAQNPNTAKYQVDALFQNVDQPMIGFSFDVKSTIIYVVKSDGNQKMFPITATGTASATESFMGSERLRIATEKSIKENIKQFISDVSAFFASNTASENNISFDDAQKKCTELGFQKGNENYLNCVLKLSK